MLNRTEFGDHVDKVTDWIQSYFENIENYPVKSQISPGTIKNQLPKSPPLKGEPIDSLMNDLDSIIMPGITHWQHPNYHAYFTANASVESLYGEMITSAIAAQCMIWETSPAAAELEERMMEWLRIMLELPEHMEGVIQDTASTATLVAILTAREVATQFSSNMSGVPTNLRVYCSEQTHSSIDKAVAISGIGKHNLIKIRVNENLEMIPDHLKFQIEKDIQQGYTPCCVVSSLGTTGTVAVDPISEISTICEKYRVWHHIDAAFAGSAMILPEYRNMIDGVERADSFVFNPHKWLFTHFDCTAYFVKDKDALIKTFAINPEYLKTKTQGIVNDYRDWGIQLGRRFRALKLWFVIRSYGVEGLREKLRHHISLSSKFIDYVRNHSHLELVTSPIFNFSCLRVKDDEKSVDQINELTSQLLDALNKSGKVFLTHTKVHGWYAIRVVLGQTYLEKKHLKTLISTIESELLKLL